MNMANLETYYMNLSLTTISRLPLSMKSTAASVSNASRLSWRIIGVARRLWFQWSRRLFSTTRQRANDASRDKPCFDDNLDAITSTQTSKHRNIINICRKHHEMYIRTMSLQYTISLAKPRHLDGTPEGLDTKMASYLKYPGPGVLVLLLLHPLHWNEGFVLQLIDLAVPHPSSSKGTTLHIETCLREHCRVYAGHFIREASPTLCRICQSKTLRLLCPTCNHRICQKTLSSLGARWKRIFCQLCLTKKTPSRAKVS